MTDFALPGFATVHLVAKRNLPAAPDAWGIRRKALGQPGPAVDDDADPFTAQRQLHAVPPLSLENPTKTFPQLTNVRTRSMPHKRHMYNDNAPQQIRCDPCHAHLHAHPEPP